MRIRPAWLLAGAGIAALVAARFLRPAPRAVPEPPADPRADELRQRIAESREIVDEREVFEQAETPVDQADLDARRRDVHARGRATLERMRSDPPS